MDCDYERTFADGKAGFAQCMEGIEEHLEKCGIPVGIATKVMIALDEVISNILNYGAQGTVPEITVRLAGEEDDLVVEVSDDGIPFNPLTLPEPDTSLSVEDRPIGGLGIHIVRELMDRVEYEHDGKRNRLRFAKNCNV